MPGFSNSTNKFGPTPFIVDPISGDGSYTTVQSAIDACSLAGGGIVYIRNGTYVESLVWPSFVSLQGVNVDGRLISGSQVIIDGNATFGTAGIRTASDIAFTSAAGDTFTINNAVGGVNLLLKSCAISAPGGIAINSIPGVGAVGGLNIIGCNLSASGDVIVATQGGTVNISVNSILLSTAGSCVNIADAVSLNCTNSSFSAQAGHDFLTDSSSLNNNVSFCTLNSGLETVNIVSGELNVVECKIDCSSPSGLFATGAGTLGYGDLVLSGSATSIDTALTLTNYASPFFKGNLLGQTTTVGAVSNTILTLDLGTIPGSYTLTVTACAYDSVTPSGFNTIQNVGLRTDGVTATFVTNSAVLNGGDGPLAGGAISLSTAGNSLIIDADGVAGVTVNWKCVVSEILFQG